ncbi:superkiller complex protein 8-like isoform X1 [Ptychodera flava]|uniref:superkiller complex protein 8-like isoform X1 n=2 Tax=Ptychodera flava TaxID=63121 RepID=UPI00396A4C92
MSPFHCICNTVEALYLCFVHAKHSPLFKVCDLDSGIFPGKHDDSNIVHFNCKHSVASFNFYFASKLHRDVNNLLQVTNISQITIMAHLYTVQFKQEQAHEDSIWSVAWARSETDGTDYIATGSVDDLVKIWKWENDHLELKYTLEGHQLGVVSVDINPAGTIAGSSSLDSHIRLWDLESGKQMRIMDAGPVDAWTIAFSPDNRMLATGSHTGKINLFGVESGKKENELDTRGKFTLSIAYSPDGKYIASGAIDGIVNIFDIHTGKLLHTLEGHAMPIRSLCFSPDSQLLVTASDDGHIKIYDVQHANLAGTLSGHGSWVLSVNFSPDNTHFVSCSSDKSVKVWDAGTRQCVATFYDHYEQVWQAKYNGNGAKIVSVSDDRAIHVYDCPL